jgi:ABC-type dipeptide/oligopeptide/nickel transport system permease component
MTTYIFRRLLLMIPTLIGVTAVVFFVMAFSPGGVTVNTLSEAGSVQEGDEARRHRQYLKRRYGLDQPKVVQYLRWLNQVSPVGFRTSSEIALDEDLERELWLTLQQQHPQLRQTQLDQLTYVIEALSAYLGASPEVLLHEVSAAVDDPTGAGVELLQRPGHDVEASVNDVLEASQVRQVPELIAALQFEVTGLDRTLWGRPAIKMPDLGRSLTGVPVGDRLADTLPVTLLLNILALPIIYVFAVTVGVYAARHRGGWFDIGSGTVLLALWSFPVIGAGVLLIGYLANRQYLDWFPTGGLHAMDAAQMTFLPRATADGFERGYLLDAIWHLVLPVLCLVYTGFTVLAKIMRGSLLDTLSADYVRTARAKGLADRVVLWRHAFRNALLPLITMAASILPALLAGSVVVENIFSIQGMGKLGVDAAFAKDRELLMAITLIAGLITLTSDILRDVLYAAVDPRVVYE